MCFEFCKNVERQSDKEDDFNILLCIWLLNGQCHEILKAFLLCCPVAHFFTANSLFFFLLRFLTEVLNFATKKNVNKKHALAIF
jgi:hypothetical protein